MVNTVKTGGCVTLERGMGSSLHKTHPLLLHNLTHPLSRAIAHEKA